MSGTVQVVSGRSATRPVPRESQVFDLALHQLMRVRDAKGARVRVLAGALWITQDGDLRDVVLNAGEEFVLDRSGMALLHPLGRESVRLALGKAGAQDRRASFSGALATA